ncbi:MEDS domain-containing protein [Dactylosporangium sp. CS-033363]|uniref:MEDS domain-containing protein n=1 Tax=Dactylosporangium sp. CS-033363 TaxID=3239935 RepID=UPI003D8BE766
MRAHAPSAADLAPGDHVCWRYSDDAAHRAALAGYIAGGVRAGQKIVHYRADAAEPDVPGAAAARRTGQFTSEPVDRTRPFDAGAWIAMLVEIIDAARRDGWTGVRFAGDMVWSLGHLADDKLLAYESRINALYAGTDAIGLCLYDVRRFEPAALGALGRVHPDTAHADGDGDRPLARVAATDEPLGMRLTGEFDASNGGCLEPVLAGLAARAAGAPLVVDVTGLEFADLSALRTLVRAAGTVSGGLRIVGAGPTLQRIVELCGRGPVEFA